MPVTHTNRKGQTYFLCKSTTKTGKTRFYFARQPQGDPVEQIPEGYKIGESVNGLVFLAKDRPLLIRPEEIAAVEAQISKHRKSRRYRVAAKHDRIEVYEINGPEADEMMAIFGQLLAAPPGAKERVEAELERSSRFSLVMRFILADQEERAFRAQRWCYLGSVDDWIDIDYGALKKLAARLIPILGTDKYFEIY